LGPSRLAGRTVTDVLSICAAIVVALDNDLRLALRHYFPPGT
jgi:hypothetical protein